MSDIVPFDSCHYDLRGRDGRRRLHCAGYGMREPGDLITISANGVIHEMIVTGWTRWWTRREGGPTWQAIDVDSYRDLYETGEPS